MNIKTESYGQVSIDRFPNECPYCHHTIIPYHENENINGSQKLELVFSCPNEYCNKLFIGYYNNSGQMVFWFQKTSIGVPKEKIFPEIISQISPQFIIIYGESFFAEQYNLKNICGVGYRKSLEFLIKDYAMGLKPEQSKDIRNGTLQNCIKKNIENANVKAIAERAAWLGNDETHYERLWDDKDLDDLKKLIDITVHWIVMEEETKSVISGMQSKKEKVSPNQK